MTEPDTAAPLAPVPEFPKRLVYLGTPAMAVAPLEALVANGFEVALVVTGADKRRGRGGDLSPCPVKHSALALGLPVTHRVEDVLDVGADLGVVVAYGRLIRRPVLERVPMINIHFSLLPRWRGAAPVERALLAGDATTGTCLMQLEEGLDTGPVYDRVELPIRSRATADELRRELVALGTEQLLRSLGSGLRNPIPQVGEATYASKIAAEELRIDWGRSSDEIDRLVRLGPAWTTFRGKRLKVLSAIVVGASAVPESVPEPEPGSLAGLVVRCGGATLLRLDMVQPEGKGAMEASSWVNGARPVSGERLGD